MRDRWLQLATFVAAVGVAIAHGLLKPAPAPREVEDFSASLFQEARWQGRVAPDFHLTLLDGTEFRLADVVGDKVVVLNFFATWCKPCRDEMPELMRFQAQWLDRPFLLLGIDAGEDEETVATFASKLRLTFPIAIDSDKSVCKLFGVDSYPTTVVIGADGRIVRYQTGAIANAEVVLFTPVSSAIAEIEAGRGATSEEYLAALARQPERDGSRKEASGLAPRYAALAAEMDCPCGCDDKVAPCTCRTATRIKARLADLGDDERSDTEIIESLNAEFCVGAS